MLQNSNVPEPSADADPPAFVKERLMARVHEDAAYPENDDLLYGPPVSGLTRFLNLLPGYGSRLTADRPAQQHSAVRRRAGIFVALLFGSLASAYGIGSISHVVQRAEDARERVIERVRHTQVYAERFVAPLRAATLAAAASNPIDLGATSASLIPRAPEELAIRPVEPLRLQGLRAHLDAAKTTMIAPTAEVASIDLNSLEGAMYFMSDRTGQHFTLKPVNDVEQGKASVYWNPKHSEALFTAEDLEPTTDGQRYTLSYQLDDGTREQLLAFEAPGGGHRQVTIHRVPGPHVVGAQLILESGYKTGQTKRDVVLAAAARLQNK